MTQLVIVVNQLQAFRGWTQIMLQPSIPVYEAENFAATTGASTNNFRPSDRKRFWIDTSRDKMKYYAVLQGYVFCSRVSVTGNPRSGSCNRRAIWSKIAWQKKLIWTVLNEI